MMCGLLSVWAAIALPPFLGQRSARREHSPERPERGKQEKKNGRPAGILHRPGWEAGPGSSRSAAGTGPGAAPVASGGDILSAAKRCDGRTVTALLFWFSPAGTAANRGDTPQNPWRWMSTQVMEDRRLNFTTPRERLAEALRAGSQRDEFVAEVTKIVADVAVRIFDSIGHGLAELDRVAEKVEEKVARSWASRAIDGIREIEDAGSLAPGLSHHAIYIEELKATLTNTITLDDFLAKLEAVRSKWGSRINYPLYAGGRKKQLDELKRKVQTSTVEEEARSRAGAEQALAKEVGRVQEETADRINLGVTEFDSILIDALGWEKDAEAVVQLRWFLIGAMTGFIFNALNKRLDEDQTRIQDLLYFATERVMRTVYESFQHEVKRSMKGRGPSDRRSTAGRDLGALIREEIKMSTRAVAEFETKLKRQQLNGQIIAAIRRLLKTRWDFVQSDPELFAGISAGLRGDVMMEDFVGHLKRVPGLEDQAREEIIATLKTSVEPFRSLYYVKINYVRYLKGLSNFQKSL
jgi:hypothetical protein